MSHRLIIISISLLILKVSVSVIKEKIYQLLIKDIAYYIVTQNLCSFISSFFSFIHKNFIHENYDIVGCSIAACSIFRRLSNSTNAPYKRKEELMPFGCSNTLNYLAFQSFDYECT
jgi:hypothetical protein